MFKGSQHINVKPETNSKVKTFTSRVSVLLL